MVIAVPQIVARGIVFSGSITLPAGTVADSSPRNAHSVIVADAVTAARLSGCGSTRMTDASPLPSSTIASTTIASNGITLSTVVTIWTTPICRTPRQLRNVRIQMIAHETIAGPPTVCLIAGTSSARYATVPVTIAALPIQTAIQ